MASALALPRLDGAVHPPHRLLSVLRRPGRAWFRRRYDVRIHGEQHVPLTGPAIIASNRARVMKL